MTTQTARPLRRILGLGFGLALVFGSTIGVGILRLPGLVAAALGDRTLIMVFWAVGGLYALMGAVAVAELAAMIPETGGFRVYARRAFGEGVGFAVGWCDWLVNVAALAYVSMTAVTFLGALWPAAAANPRALAIALIAAFTGIHWVGLRIGSSLTSIISVSIGLMLMILVVGCFLVAAAAGTAEAPLAGTAASVPWLLCYMSAFLAVLVVRHREPELARPYVVLAGSMAFLIAAVVEDPRSGIISAVFVGACVPVYAWLSRGRRLRAAASTA